MNKNWRKSWKMIVYLNVFLMAGLISQLLSCQSVTAPEAQHDRFMLLRTEEMFRNRLKKYLGASLNYCGILPDSFRNYIPKEKQVNISFTRSTWNKYFLFTRDKTILLLNNPKEKNINSCSNCYFLEMDSNLFLSDFKRDWLNQGTRETCVK